MDSSKAEEDGQDVPGEIGAPGKKLRQAICLQDVWEVRLNVLRRGNMPLSECRLLYTS